MAKNMEAIQKFYKECIINNDILNTPTLYKKDKKGDIRFISFHIIITASIIEATDNDGHWIQNIKKEPIEFTSKITALYYSASGKEGCKITISKPSYVLTGKNIGRKNETTPFQQAINEVRSVYTKRYNMGDRTTLEEAEEGIKFEEHKRVNIMLLQNAKENLKKIKYPCYMQEKLDGIHAVAVMFGDAVDIYTRGKTKELKLPHIRKDIEEFYKNSQLLENSQFSRNDYYGMYISGELYDPNIRQDIISMVMSGNDATIKLYVFDVFWVANKMNKNNLLAYADRFKIMKQFIKDINSENILMIPTYEAKNIGDIEKYYSEVKEKDGEGLVIRNMDGLYEYGKRSFGVMKYKVREDAEFLIVDYVVGDKGKYAGFIIFVAETSNGLRFNVEPNWKPEDRIRAVAEFDLKYKNKKATISYDNISKLGIPQQAKLIRFIE